MSKGTAVPSWSPAEPTKTRPSISGGQPTCLGVYPLRSAVNANIGPRRAAQLLGVRTAGGRPEKTLLAPRLSASSTAEARWLFALLTAALCGRSCSPPPCLGRVRRRSVEARYGSMLEAVDRSSPKALSEYGGANSIAGWNPALSVRALPNAGARHPPAPGTRPRQPPAPARRQPLQLLRCSPEHVIPERGADAVAALVVLEMVAHVEFA